MIPDQPTLTPGSIFDIHVHLLDEPALDAEFLAFAREWGIPFGLSCLGPNNHMLAEPTVEECRACNDMVIKAMEDEPDLTHGFCYVSPAHGQQAIEEMRRCIGHGMLGVKLWVAVKCSDERTYPIAEESITLGVPILQHAYLRWEEILPGESKPDDIAKLARAYPEMRMIMAHMALRWREGVDAIADYPNILVDTCGFDPESGSVEYAVSRLGAERVLYGSDAPGRDILCQIGKVMAAGISEGNRAKVLRTNAERLLGLPGAAR